MDDDSPLGLLAVLPTRGRPGSVQRFLESFAANTVLADTDLVVVADEDDPRTADVYRAAESAAGYPATHRIEILPRKPLQEKLNAAILPVIGGYRAAVFWGDDCVFRTHGWDKRILAALDELGGEGIIGCNDLTRHGELFNHAAISSGIVRALGYYANPAVGHYGMDDCWTELGRSAGCLRYLEDVVVEHLHPVYGKAPPDQVYTDTWARWWDHDMAALGHWRAGQARADLDKVRGAVHASRR